MMPANPAQLRDKSQPRDPLPALLPKHVAGNATRTRPALLNSTMHIPAPPHPAAPRPVL